VGAAAGKRLRQKGYGTLGDLQGLDDRAALALGEDGPRWVRLARGEDNRAVTPGRARKSVSSERTLDDPVTAPEDIDIHLRAAAERVGRDLRRDGWFATAVTIKLKTAAFQSITRSHTLERPSQSTATLLATARTLAQPLATGTAYRLIGVGCEVTRTPPVEQDLFTGTSEAKRLKLEHTLDKLAERFGNKVGWGPAKPSR
jgi:DNA polymerase-4